MLEDSEDSSDSLHSIEYNNASVSFSYNDPALLSGIHRAVVDKSLEKLKELVNGGANPRSVDNNGNSPLHVAVLTYQKTDGLKIIEYLISLSQVDVNEVNLYGQTPLLLSVDGRKEELVYFFLEHGANSNIPTAEDVTPLHLSIVYSINISKCLIQAGADVNYKDYSGDAPLHNCVMDGDIESLCMLLYYNADTSITNSGGLTPFMLSLAVGKKYFSDVLFEYVTDFNLATHGAGMSTLYLAITEEYSRVVEMVERGADVNYRREMYNIFNLGVPLDIEVFKYVWQLIDYDCIWEGLDKNILVYYMQTDLVSLEYKIEFISYILENSDIKTLLSLTECSKEYPLLFLIVEFFHEIFDLNKIHEVCFILLSGNAQLYQLDLDLIYEHFGYCELFEVLLFIDAKTNSDDQKFNFFPQLIYSTLTSDVLYENLFEKIISSGLCLNCIDYEIFLKFVRVPLPKIRSLLHSITDADATDIDQILYYLNTLRNVPKLKELASKTFADYLKSEMSSHNFFAILKKLELPLAVKQIMSFEFQLYEENNSSVEFLNLRKRMKMVRRSRINEIYQQLIID